MNDVFSGIIGHARAVARLRAMLANGAVPHALLFHGPRRSGKAALASALASALLGAEDAAKHPDFRLVERPRDEKTGKLKKSIPIEAVRELTEHLRMSSFMGGAKVAVIDGADALSEEAANALLKSLEEPSFRAHVVLLAEDASRLPRTIVSRSAAVELRRVGEAEIAAALVARGMSAPDAARAAFRADGRPGAALAFLEESGVVDWYETEERRWNALRSAPVHRRFALLAELAPPRADREETVLKIRDVLDAWQGFLRRELRDRAPGAPANLRRLFRLRASLDANVQPRLLLERFVLTLDR
ncbi:MAG TPA: AAA family ATPase [Patescibacteria group bacterium]|nr:AAA family ATPase [Patescibacteria group bacterium]